MLKQLIFISLSLLLSFVAFGQEKITIKEEQLSDVSPASLYKAKNQIIYLYKVGEGDFQAIGYKGESIEEILKTDEAAYKEFKKFKRNLAFYKTFYWVGTAVPVGLLILADNENITLDQSIATAITGLAVMIGSYTTSLVSLRNAPKHLHNAVMIYNLNLENQ